VFYEQINDDDDGDVKRDTLKELIIVRKMTPNFKFVGERSPTTQIDERHCCLYFVLA